MSALTSAPPLASCAVVCGTEGTADALNRDCFCLAVDARQVHGELERVLAQHGLPAVLADSHPHLFSALPLFVARRHVQQATEVLAAVQTVVALPAFREAVLARSPAIARFDPGSPGGLLGLDFHLSADGPKLIEINTNPGGALLNAVLGQAQQACVACMIESPTDAAQVEASVLAVMLAEWRAQRGDRPLRLVAIVDEAPTRQFLYPEFLLFQQLFESAGIGARICAATDLSHRDGKLWLGEEAIDMVYNRLTDFSLEAPEQAPLRDAYLAREVVVSPHPRAHALYADKRNLQLLGDAEFLRGAGLDEKNIAVLLATVPLTQLLTSDNRDALWADRRHWFFKPAAGFGSKASYRGDKLTRRVWEEMALGCYVAQRIVAPSERRLEVDGPPLKVDVRCYGYGDTPLLYAARLYQGQTTNFRTPGGGFAPVLTGGN